MSQFICRQIHNHNHNWYIDKSILVLNTWFISSKLVCRCQDDKVSYKLYQCWSTWWCCTPWLSLQQGQAKTIGCYHHILYSSDWGTKNICRWNQSVQAMAVTPRYIWSLQLHHVHTLLQIQWTIFLNLHIDRCSLSESGKNKS